MGALGLTRRSACLLVAALCVILGAFNYAWMARNGYLESGQPQEYAVRFALEQRFGHGLYGAGRGRHQCTSDSKNLDGRMAVEGSARREISSDHLIESTAENIPKFRTERGFVKVRGELSAGHQ